MKKKEELLNHNYDGIQEYDKDLPVWWQVLFVLTVVFSVVYVLYFHYGSGKFTSQQLEENMAEIEVMKKTTTAPTTSGGDEQSRLLAMVSDSVVQEKGKAIYAAKCLACHGDKGQGLIGPNLTDDYSIHGSKITDIRNVVVNGVLDKGMIAWGQMMPPDEIDQVVSFIWSMHGSNPPNPKAPQGELSPR